MPESTSICPESSGSTSRSRSRGRFPHERVVLLVAEHADPPRIDRVVGELADQRLRQLAVAPLTGKDRGESLGAVALGRHMQQVARIGVGGRLHRVLTLGGSRVAAEIGQEADVRRDLVLRDPGEEPREGRECRSVRRLPDDEADGARVVLQVKDVLREVVPERVVGKGAGADLPDHGVARRGEPCRFAELVQDQRHAPGTASPDIRPRPAARPCQPRADRQDAPYVGAHRSLGLVRIVVADRLHDLGVLLHGGRQPARDLLGELAHANQVRLEVLDQ